MTRYVAFLRGINLGNRRLKMDELRRHFEGLDVESPSTYLASGNVIFDHGGAAGGELERRIEAHLADALGYPVDTFLRPLDFLGDLVRRAEADQKDVKPHVIFLRDPVDSRIEDELATLETPDDSFRVLGREVVWLRRGRLSESSVEPRDLEKAFGGRTSTMRTLNTVRRIVARFGS